MGKIKIIKMDCPQCGSLLVFGDNLESVSCTSCGSSFVIDDHATKLDRIIRAVSAARRRDMEMRMEETRRRNDEALRVAKEESKRNDKDFFLGFIPLVVLMVAMVVLYRW